MSAEDKAIVVGVSDYPGLTSLRGPENDAQAFYDWLVKKMGGDVPPENVKLIRSSDFERSSKATDAQPTAERIERAFLDLDDESMENDRRGNGIRVGRRLYLYFSGHGIAPSLISEGYLPQFDDSALLTANAMKGRWAYHIAGKPWANLFFKNGYFDEIVLFMDCCREYFPNVPLNFVKLEDSTVYRELDETKLLFGFATKWNRLARERELDNGTVRGVFTLALLAGLEGAAADHVTGKVTARTLYNYMRENMKTFFAPADLNNGEISREPDFKYYDKSSDQLVFVQHPVLKFPVKLHLPPRLVGGRVEVKGERNGNPFEKIVETAVAPQIWEFEIERGFYLAIGGDGTTETFQVVGKLNSEGAKEVENVQFI